MIEVLVSKNNRQLFFFAIRVDDVHCDGVVCSIELHLISETIHSNDLGSVDGGDDIPRLHASFFCFTINDD